MCRKSLQNRSFLRIYEKKEPLSVVSQSKQAEWLKNSLFYKHYLYIKNVRNSEIWHGSCLKEAGETDIGLGRKMKDMAKKTGGVGMRKVLLTLALGIILTMGMSSAQAVILDGWRLDFTSLGGGNNTNIDHVVLTGNATVTQYYGGNGVLDVGDPFTENFMLWSLTYTPEGGGLSGLALPPGLQMYAYGQNITGSVATINPDGSFIYSFDPLQQISLVLDTDSNPGNGISNLLAIGTTILPSGGIANPNFLGGAGINGTTNLTLSMSNLLAGVWYDNAGNDLSLLPGGWLLGLVNTNNLTGTPTLIQDGVIVTVSSSGQLNLSVIPEPTSMLLLGGGLLGLAGAGLRKRKKA